MRNILTTGLILIGFVTQGQTYTNFATTPSPVANHYAQTNNGLKADNTVWFTKYAGDSTMIMFDATGKAFKINKNLFAKASSVVNIDTTSLSNRININKQALTDTSFVLNIPKKTANALNADYYDRSKGWNPPAINMGLVSSYLIPAGNTTRSHFIFWNYPDGYTVGYFVSLNFDSVYVMSGSRIGKTIGWPNPTPTFGGTFTGNWSTTAYTTNVNDSIKFSFTGTGFLFYSYTDNRGGIWELSLNNGLYVDTFSVWASPDVFKWQNIRQNIPNATYSARLRFLGADPLHAPSGGTARGWIYLDTLSPIRFFGLKYYTNGVGTIHPIVDSTKWVLANNTVSDWAVLADTGASPYLDLWIPGHGSGGAQKNRTFQIWADGTAIGFDFTSKPPLMGLKSVAYKQSYTAHNKINTSLLYPLWDGVILEEYTGNGERHYSHTLNLRYRRVYFAPSYLSQVAGFVPNTNKMGYGDSTYLVQTAISRETYLPKPFNSVIFFDTTWGGYAAYKTGVYEALDLRNNPNNNTSFFSERTDGVNKLYWVAFSLGFVPQGRKYSIHSEYRIGRSAVGIKL